MSTIYIPLSSKSGAISKAFANLAANLKAWHQARHAASERRVLAARLAELRDRDPRLFADACADDTDLPSVVGPMVPVFACAVISAYLIGGRD